MAETAGENKTAEQTEPVEEPVAFEETEIVEETISDESGVIVEVVPETEPASEAEDPSAAGDDAGTEEDAGSVLDQILQQVADAEELMLVVMEATTDEEEPVTVRAEFVSGVLPEDVQLSVQTVEMNTADTDAALEAVAGTEVAGSDNVQVKALDISFYVLDEDGARIEKEPNGEVRISMHAAFLESSAAAEVVHVEADGTNTLMETETDEDTQEVTLTTDSFSVYAIVYTVDFHWEVDGKTYDFSIPGGGYVSFEKLMEVLGVAYDDTGDGSADAQNEPEDTDDGSAEVQDPQEDADISSEDDQDAGDEDADETETEDSVKLTLEDVEVSQETKRFAANVEKVEFSNPDLVWIGKVEADATVGQIKEEHRLECEYSYRLTWDEIEKINASEVKAGDPAAGGPGTKAFIAGGAVLTVTAVLGYAWKGQTFRRKP